jgi:divalent metal cation (Fe/Co/Zn/Cd) transporter
VIDRASIDKAILFEWLTIAWTAIVAVAGIAGGAAAHSVSLTAFGLDGGVECICAGIVLRRLRLEAAHGHEFDDRHERQAAQIVGVLLLAAAAYVTADAVIHLVRHEAQEIKAIALVLTVASIPVLVPLSSVKLGLARKLKSIALRVDAIGNVVCWYLAVVVIVGIAAQAALHIWWFDGAASLLIVALLVREGVGAIVNRKEGS